MELRSREEGEQGENVGQGSKEEVEQERPLQTGYTNS
jgi:hypothetical protein